MPAVGERGRPIKAQVRARAKAKPKVIYGPPAPKRVIYGPPAPRPKPKVIYGPPAPRVKAKPKAGPPAPRPKPKVVYGPPAPKPKRREPRKPTFAETQAHAARTRNAVREAAAEERRTRVDTSAAGVERYKQSKEYQDALKKAREARERQQDSKRSFVGKVLDEITNKETREKYERQAAKREGKGGGATMGRLMASVHAPLAGHRLAAAVPGGEKVSKVLGAGSADLGELISTMPSSIAHTVKTAVTEPQKLPGMIVEPYVETAKHPIKSFTERPVSTAALVAPVARVPGLTAGKVLRKTGKQTLEREPATLPGTALKAKREGSRDAMVRAWQSRRDRKKGGGTVSSGEVKKRVDEFYDYARHKSHQAADRAAKEAKDQGMDPETAKAHVEQARKDSDVQMQEAFAREFGANERPAVGVAEKKSAKAEKKAAEQRKREAREREDAAQAEVRRAYGEASAARGTGTSQRLTALEAERKAALAAVASARAGQHAARLEQAKAHGSARVSAATPKTTPRLRELQAKLKKAEKESVTEAVVAARAAVREADKKVVAIERQMQRERETGARLAGVTEGRSKAGKMTAGAGRRVADQAEKIGVLTDVLTGARRGAANAREALKIAEGEARAANKVTTGDLKKQISAEQKRIAGVAPRSADRLLSAMSALEAAPGNVSAARARVRDLENEISGERGRVSGVPPAQHDALLRALEEREAATTSGAQRRAEHRAAEARHSDVRQQAIDATLTAPKGEGRIFTHEGDAKKVAQRLNEQAAAIPAGGISPVRMVEHGDTGMQVMRRRGNVNLPLEFKVTKVGDDRYAVVPKVAAKRLRKHEVVGTSPNVVAKGMRRSRGALTKATLPFSLKWLGGQIGEAALRSLIERAGPADAARVGKVAKRMNEIEPGAGDDFLTRISGGQFGVTGAAREFADADTLAKEFEGTSLEQLGRGATALGNTLPGRAGKGAINKWNKAVLGNINGFIENNARRGMAGQYIKDTFNERRFNALSDKAIDEAARGLMGTEAQVAAARAVDRMYGQYSRFSPEMRSLMAHWTPFLPWYLNSAKWLLGTLPRRHPVATSLMASMSVATEDWRKANDLSTRQEDHVPDFLLGSYPIFKDRGLSRVGAMTPFGVGSDLLGSANELTLPNVRSAFLNSIGLDWTGTKFMRDPETGKKFTKKQKALRTAGSLAESHIPALGLAGRLSGLSPRYLDRRAPEDIPSFRDRLSREVPLFPVTPPDSGGIGGLDIDPIDVEGIDLGEIEVD